MPGCLFRGGSIKLLVLIYRLLLPQLCDVDRITVDSPCTVYVLLKHLTQQVAHGLCNDNAPSTITQGKTGKIQNSVLQTYWVHQQWQRFEEDVDYVMPLTARALNPIIDNSAITLEGYGASEIQKAQENDSDLGVITSVRN